MYCFIKQIYIIVVLLLHNIYEENESETDRQIR